MNVYYLGLTSLEQELLNGPHLPFVAFSRFASNASSLAPATPSRLKKTFTKSAIRSSYLPALYFARGALEKDKKHNPKPFFSLMSETDEIPLPRPIPRNRLLLSSLCRGKGTLKQNEQGHTYLDVDNQFILSLLPYLKSQNVVKPPYFNLFGSPDGAHIPVIPTREAYFQDLGPIKEVGQEFIFEIEGLYSVKPSTWPEVEEVWFFKVHSPQLENLRRKYFLPALPGGQFFTMAVAVKPATSNVSSKPRFMRINPAIHAA